MFLRLRAIYPKLKPWRVRRSFLDTNPEVSNDADILFRECFQSFWERGYGIGATKELTPQMETAVRCPFQYIVGSTIVSRRTPPPECSTYSRHLVCSATKNGCFLFQGRMTLCKPMNLSQTTKAAITAETARRKRLAKTSHATSNVSTHVTFFGRRS